MNAFQTGISRLLGWYAGSCPGHRGKWRLVETMVSLFGLQSGYSAPVKALRRHRWFELDLNGHIERKIYYQEAHEIWDTVYIESVVQPDWVVMDIGANIGWYSLMASKKVGPTGKIFSIEISPDEMNKLRRNVALNQLTNIEPLLLAIADQPGRVFITDTRSAGTTSLAASAGEARHEIEATSLDHFVDERKLQRIDLIKCDIEGAEVKFLTGAHASLARFKPILMIELNPSALERFGNRLEEVTGPLTQLGYTLHQVGRDGLSPLTRLPTGRDFINVVALPPRS